MIEVGSKVLAGGGGSWSYAAVDGGTHWTQSNTLTFRGNLAYRLLGALTAWQLRRGTRQAMRAAKRALEDARAGRGG